jgi:hypothetical protein
MKRRKVIRKYLYRYHVETRQYRLMVNVKTNSRRAVLLECQRFRRIIRKPKVDMTDAKLTFVSRIPNCPECGLFFAHWTTCKRGAALRKRSDARQRAFFKRQEQARKAEAIKSAKKHARELVKQAEAADYSNPTFSPIVAKPTLVKSKGERVM